MKQLKKMMLVMTLALCALGLTACRTNSNDNTTNTTENGNATGNTSATETNGATDNDAVDAALAQVGVQTDRMMRGQRRIRKIARAMISVRV